MSPLGNFAFSENKPIWLYRLKFNRRCSYALGYIHKGLNFEDIHPLSMNRMRYAKDFYIELNDYDLARLGSEASEASKPLIDRFLDGQDPALETEIRATYVELANRLDLSGTGDTEMNTAELDRLEPFLAFTILRNHLFFPENSTSFDHQVFALAHSLRKSIFSMDHRSTQRTLLEEIYTIDNLRQLAFNLRASRLSNHEDNFVASRRRHIESQINAYLKGNISQLEDALLTAPHSVMKSEMHAERNRDWANKIYEVLLRQDRSEFNMFLGGVSHFIGDNSVLVYLRTFGIETTIVREQEAQNIMTALGDFSVGEQSEDQLAKAVKSDPCLNGHF